MSEFPVIHPKRATVVPRAWRHPDGESLPLEVQIRELLERGWRRPVSLFGAAGTGKSAALAHLAAVLPADRVQLIDQLPTGAFLDGPHERLVVFAWESRVESAEVAFELAPWEEDDLIEYVLHIHREKSKTIMPRVLGATDRVALDGLPELWVPVLEAFAADEGLQEIEAALRQHLRSQLGDGYGAACADCLESMLGSAKAQRVSPNLPLAVLRHALPVTLLAAERLAELIGEGRFEALQRALKPELILRTGRLFGAQDARLKKLEEALADSQQMQPQGVSLLLAANRAWRPENGILRHLNGCQAAGAQWKGVDLRHCNMTGANLQRVDLREARLAHAVADGANFYGANLQGADLQMFNGSEAEFSHANFTGVVGPNIILEHAALEGAVFRDADLDRAVMDEVRAPGACFDLASLRRASFKRAQLEGAYFSRADLTEARFRHVRFKDVKLDWACFVRAELTHCDLEELEAENVVFEGANLSGSYLTASTLTGVNFRNASLRQAGLAEVQWENADLRGADLTGATFHMGSSRSGLVNSTIASEGTRTGFYTDEYNEQDYKPPEEIRKANLCGADLRGALVEDTDFYLVDLRGAKYTEDQARHFARCGAILRARY